MDKSHGLVKANEGIKHQKWDILGQTYVPLQVTESSFSWHATFPDGTFVPSHIHPTQDESIYILEGSLDIVLDGDEIRAEAGDLVTLPLNIPHSINNRSGSTVKALFTVSPTGKLYDYFIQLDRLTDKEAIERLAAAHEVPFAE